MSEEITENVPQDLTKDQLLAMYRRMRLIRAFENTAQKRFEAGEIAAVQSTDVANAEMEIRTRLEERLSLTAAVWA